MMWTVVLLACGTPDPAPNIQRGSEPTTLLDSAPSPMTTGATGDTADSAALCETLVAGETQHGDLDTSVRPAPTWVYIPEGADCTTPVWVDLHVSILPQGPGEATPEQSGAESLQAFADQFGVVLVRPRGTETTDRVSWSAEPALDAVVIEEVLTQLGWSERRRWMSAASQATVTATYVLATDDRWEGFALLHPTLVGSTPWQVVLEGPKVYAFASTRYAVDDALQLDQLLDDTGHQPGDRWVDVGATGTFDSVPWALERGLAFLDGGQRPGPPADPSPEWSESQLGTEALFAIDPVAPSLRAAAGDGWVRGDDLTAPVASSALLDLCGDRALTASDVVDVGSGASIEPLPFGYSLDCDGSTTVAATSSGALRFEAAGTELISDGRWNAAAVRGDKVLLAGMSGELELHVGATVSTTTVLTLQPLDLLAAEIDDSVALVTDSEGAIFRAEAPFDAFRKAHDGSGLPLYAVALDDSRAAAVGHGGQVWVSDDAGDTWAPLAIDRDLALYDVRIHGDMIEAVGAEGAVFRHPWPL